MENCTINSKRDEALLSWIQEFAPYGVITLDMSLQVQSWNHWMELHTGRQSADVAGKTLFELFPTLEKKKVSWRFERALSGESSVISTSLHHFLLPLPSPIRSKGCEWMRQTARIAPLLCNDKEICGVVLVIEDVTQRELQADALRKQHHRDEILAWALAHLLKSDAPRKTVRQLFFKIAAHLDFDTFFLYLQEIEKGTPVLYAMGGIPLELEKELGTCPLTNFVFPENQPFLVLDSVPSRQDPGFAVLKKAGISAAILIPLRTNERNLGLLCFGTRSRESISHEESELLLTMAQYLATAVDRENKELQLRQAQNLLGIHAEELEKKVEERTSRLQETITELETFSYTMAHDLKAPIRGMLGYCDVLLEDFANEMPVGANLIVKKLKRASVQMEDLTHDLLNFSNVSRDVIVMGHLEIAPILEDLSVMRLPVVREALVVRKPLHGVKAHGPLLQQVLANLIDNAIKFVEPGTVPHVEIFTELVDRTTPNTRTQPLLFSAAQPSVPELPGYNPGSARVRLWVIDNGIGVPKRVQQKIFGIFERGVTSGIYEGTGIGLAIVSRGVQRMGGTCGVESDGENGSQFWVELEACR